MAFWPVIAVAAGGAALGFVGSKLFQRSLRKARDDHSKRPALWNRFYSIDWGETTTNNYGFAPSEGDHPQRFQHQMYLELLDRLRAETPAFALWGALGLALVVTPGVAALVWVRRLARR